MFFDKGRDFIPREPEQGTNDLKTMRVGHSLHSRQPSRPRSAKKVEEAGFDLIISVVAEKNPPAAMCLCTGLEESVSQFPGSRLYGKLLLDGVTPHVSLFKTKEASESSCGGRDERGVSPCGAAAQAVVQMTNDQLLVTKGVQAK